MENVVEVRHIELDDVVYEVEEELNFWIFNKLEEGVPLTALIGILFKAAGTLPFYEEE